MKLRVRCKNVKQITLEKEPRNSCCLRKRPLPRGGQLQTQEAIANFKGIPHFQSLISNRTAKWASCNPVLLSEKSFWCIITRESAADIQRHFGSANQAPIRSRCFHQTGPGVMSYWNLGSHKVSYTRCTSDNCSKNSQLLLIIA